MSEFRTPLGFEEALRPPVDVRRARITPPVLRPPGRAGDVQAYAQLSRIVQRAPEVVVKVLGKTQDAGHLQRHLDYISRNGKLPLEGSDGEPYLGRDDVRELAGTWAAELAMELGRRQDSPVSRSIVLSMPAGTDPRRLEDAARAFARDSLGGRFPYVFVLHDEDRHPHVHLTVRALGSDGRRFNPRKADLEVWRQRFAQALRDRGVEAEASPRRVRGVTRKAERLPVRKLRERFERGGPAPTVLRNAIRQAAGVQAPEPSRARQETRRARIVRALAAEAVRLDRSSIEADRQVAREAAAFLKAWPPLETLRDRLRGRLQVLDRARRRDQDRSP